MFLGRDVGVISSHYVSAWAVFLSLSIYGYVSAFGRAFGTCALRTVSLWLVWVVITRLSALMGNCKNKGLKKTWSLGMWFRNNALFEKSNPVLLCGEESVFVGVRSYIVWMTGLDLAKPTVIFSTFSLRFSSADFIFAPPMPRSWALWWKSSPVFSHVTLSPFAPHRHQQGFIHTPDAVVWKLIF